MSYLDKNKLYLIIELHTYRESILKQQSEVYILGSCREKYMYHCLMCPTYLTSYIGPAKVRYEDSRTFID